MWWPLPIILAQGRLRQKNCHVFEANLAYTGRPCLKQQQQKSAANAISAIVLPAEACRLRKENHNPVLNAAYRICVVMSLRADVCP